MKLLNLKLLSQGMSGFFLSGVLKTFKLFVTVYIFSEVFLRISHLYRETVLIFGAALCSGLIGVKLTVDLLVSE